MVISPHFCGGFSPSLSLKKSHVLVSKCVVLLSLRWDQTELCRLNQVWNMTPKNQHFAVFIPINYHILHFFNIFQNILGCSWTFEGTWAPTSTIPLSAYASRTLKWTLLIFSPHLLKISCSVYFLTLIVWFNNIVFIDNMI